MYSQIINQSLRNRYFLDKMGINCWAVSDKKYNVNTIIDLPSGWKNTIIFQRNIQKNQTSNDLNHHNFIITNDELQECNHHLEPMDISIQLPAFMTGILIELSKIHWHAIRYGDWLILCDNTQVNDEQYAIWQSLQNALKIKSDTNQVIFSYLTVQYQENKVEWVDNELLWVLSGFFWRLFDKECPKKMALLTEINGAIFDDTFILKKQNTPNLIDMANNAQHKKVFWELLQS